MTYEICGYYINLDSSTERNHALKMNLESVGMSKVFTRFPAVTGSNYWHSGHKIGKSELGCLLSHKNILNKQHDNQFMLVLEDDCFLPPDFTRNLSKLIQNIAPRFSDMDIIFLGQITDYSKIYQTKALLRLDADIVEKGNNGSFNFVLLEGKPWYKWGTFAYLVMPGAGKKIHDLIDAVVNHELAIDQLLGSLIMQNKIRTKVIFPYLAGVVGAESTMEDRILNDDSKLHAAMTNLFVYNGNIDGLTKAAAIGLGDPDFNQKAFIYAQLIYQKMVS